MILFFTCSSKSYFFHTFLTFLQKSVKKCKKVFLSFPDVANNIDGQARDYSGLGKSYILSNDLNEAEASFQNALELNTLANNTNGQGSNLVRLGAIYLKSNKLYEAEASF